MTVRAGEGILRMWTAVVTPTSDAGGGRTKEDRNFGRTVAAYAIEEGGGHRNWLAH